MDKYKCWDCEKELGDLQFDEDKKKKMPRDAVEGFLYVICKECWDNDEESR